MIPRGVGIAAALALSFAGCTPESPEDMAKRDGFAAAYRASGQMMGSACNKIVLYGAGNTGFSLKCPGIRPDTARLIMADPDNPLARDLRAAGFKYYSIADLPEVKL